MKVGTIILWRIKKEKKEERLKKFKTKVVGSSKIEIQRIFFSIIIKKLKVSILFHGGFKGM